MVDSTFTLANGGSQMFRGQVFCFSAICSADRFTNMKMTVVARHFVKEGVASKNRLATVISPDRMNITFAAVAQRAMELGFSPLGLRDEPHRKHSVSSGFIVELQSRHRSIMAGWFQSMVLRRLIVSSGSLSAITIAL